MFIDFKGEKISSEMIDIFVERMIYRGVMNGNDEFLWVMNLLGSMVDTSGKYRIQGYDKKYADSLKNDKNFNIAAKFFIPLEKCRDYCGNVVKRRYIPKYWRPITIKDCNCRMKSGRTSSYKLGWLVLFCCGGGMGGVVYFIY